MNYQLPTMFSFINVYELQQPLHIMRYTYYKDILEKEHAYFIILILKKY